MLKNDTWGCAKDLGRSFWTLYFTLATYPGKVFIAQYSKITFLNTRSPDNSRNHWTSLAFIPPLRIFT